MRDDYAPLAAVYDTLTRHRAIQALYRRFRRALIDAARERDVQLRVLVDIACGTGNSTIPWTRRRGLAVIGVDRSPSMLAVARKKSAAVEWHCQDLTRLRLPRTADAVTCHFDALNHLLTPTALQRAFRRIGALLRTGGLFVFDLNTDDFLRWLDGREKLFHAGEHAYVARHRYDVETGIATFDQVWFVKRGRTYERRDVRVRERAYSKADLEPLLDRSGLHLASTTVVAEVEGKPSRKLYVAEKLA